jgi:altronate hydrolase
VPAKHKFATEDLAAGADVIMYGVLVGKAAKPISRGERLTTSNVQHQASDFHEQSGQYRWQAPDISRWKERTFAGYARPDGQVGTRNYWLVVPLVFCENRNIGVLKQAFEEELGFAPPQIYRRQVAELAKRYREGKLDVAGDGSAFGNGSEPQRSRVFENIDGIKFLLHEGGCGGTREDANNLCGLIAGYINHPNVAGATVFSLGCQNAQIGILRTQIARRNEHVDRRWRDRVRPRPGARGARRRDPSRRAATSHYLRHAPSRRPCSGRDDVEDALRRARCRAGRCGRHDR